MKSRGRHWNAQYLEFLMIFLLVVVFFLNWRALREFLIFKAEKSPISNNYSFHVIETLKCLHRVLSGVNNTKFSEIFFVNVALVISNLLKSLNPGKGSHWDQKLQLDFVDIRLFYPNQSNFSAKTEILLSKTKYSTADVFLPYLFSSISKNIRYTERRKNTFISLSGNIKKYVSYVLLRASFC